MNERKGRGVRRKRLVVAAGLVASAVLAGIALAAAEVPARGHLAADAIPIGTAMGRDWHLGGFSDLYPVGASG